MITYIKGDIFSTSADIIVQGINCEGIVNGGLAKVIREMYPAMHNEYKSLCRAGLAVPGEIMFFYSHNSKKPHLINLFIQERKRDGGPSLDLIAKSFDRLIETYPKLKIEWKNGILAMPRIGASSKKIDWENEIRPIIEEKFSLNQIPLYIYLKDFSKQKNLEN